MLKDHKIKIKVNGREVETLADILPKKPGLDILFIAKTPATFSVQKGHYFQGSQGTAFWNKLDKYNILKKKGVDYHDDCLLKNRYGITDIVKVPRDYGNEPTEEEYKEGAQRILDLIKLHKPKVLVFVYKKVLDQLIKYAFNHNSKSEYGFNPELEKYFNDSKVFAFPMPGTPCTTADAHKAMKELKLFLGK